jgi:hypothetical protein
VDLRSASLDKWAECLDGHSAFTDVQNDAVSFVDRAFRNQFHNEQLTHEELLAYFATLFNSGVRRFHLDSGLILPTYHGN